MANYVTVTSDKSKKKAKDIPVSTMNEMLAALGYKIAIVPDDTPILDTGFIVGEKEEENA